MNSSQIYVLILLIVLVIIALIVFFVKKDKRPKKLTPLASLAFGFVLAGIIFGENVAFGYGLMTIGVIVTVIDIFIKPKDN